MLMDYSLFVRTVAGRCPAPSMDKATRKIKYGSNAGT